MFAIKIYQKFLLHINIQNFKGKNNSKTLLYFVNRAYTQPSNSDSTVSLLHEHLEEVFKFKNTNVSNWIIENRARQLCTEYINSSQCVKTKLLQTLASEYAVQHDNVRNVAQKLLSTELENERGLVSQERNLKNSLMPDYQWLFVIIGRLENGVKFLVDLRTDILEFLSKTADADEYVILQQLNLSLRDLLLLWFSVGFLHLERITWQSSCDILEKISDYEAIHPIKNWLDLKKRVGPYRRCYIFTHPSMPREPLVVLHTALCDLIPTSVKGIEEAETRIIDHNNEVTFFEENKCKIKAAIFYSITSTQKGLQNIELGNYLIKEVVKKILAEFPVIHELSSLSPIPNFRLWFLEKLKQNLSSVFLKKEIEAIKSFLKEEDITFTLKKLLNNSLWTKNEELCNILEKPLLRACAWYLYKEKRRNYALNSVANFHLRNGAVMWRINWMADPSPRGVANSCGIMVNYRYYLNESETNSQNYIEKYIVKASDNVIELANERANFGVSLK